MGFLFLRDFRKIDPFLFFQTLDLSQLVFRGDLVRQKALTCLLPISFDFSDPLGIPSVGFHDLILSLRHCREIAKPTLEISG